MAAKAKKAKKKVAKKKAAYKGGRSLVSNTFRPPKPPRRK
jgi:hypothetical protein